MKKKNELLALIESGKAPDRLQATVLDLTGLKDMAKLPAEVHCHTLIWKDSPLTELPANLQVSHKLDLSGSRQLERLSDGLSVSVLVLTDCTSCLLYTSFQLQLCMRLLPLCKDAKHKGGTETRCRMSEPLL